MHFSFKNLLLIILLAVPFLLTAQNKPVEKKYPSLLWEIRGKGLKKPSYLFGTMHVSNKMVFNLSDSFFYAIKNADVVGLELNSETWQEDMISMEKQRESFNKFYGAANSYNSYDNYNNYGNDNFGFNSKVGIYEKTFRLNGDYISQLEYGLSVTPFVVNSLLYRSYGGNSQDFEEDTFLDMYIYQTGKKLGKKSAGMETIFTMEKYTTEAEIDRAAEKSKKYKPKNYDNYPEMTPAEAYRKGDLDMLDSLDRLSNESEAFTEKFLYQRNDVQVASMDTIMQKGQSLFVGVGAAHLPGKRGVIEILRRMGYKLRPIKMIDRDAEQREKIDKIRVPVAFVQHAEEDGAYTVKAPGELYGRQEGLGDYTKQYCDMANGAYYMVSRIPTLAAYINHSETMVLKRLDSLLYENIPGKIIKKEKITKNGYQGLNIVNKTRRGDVQRYNIFVLPNEVLLFKISGIDNYVELGQEANTFFNSIEFKNTSNVAQSLVPYKKGVISATLPSNYFEKDVNGHLLITASQNGVNYELHKVNVTSAFKPVDTFHIMLMEESFIGHKKQLKTISRNYITTNKYTQLNASYKVSDTTINVRYMVKGQTAVLFAASSVKNKPSFEDNILNSFNFTTPNHTQSSVYVDTFLHFSVKTPLQPIIVDSLKSLLYKYKNTSSYNYNNDKSPEYKYYELDRVMSFYDDSTKEEIEVSVNKFGKYFFYNDTLAKEEKLRDSMELMLKNPNKLAKFIDSFAAEKYKNEAWYSNARPVRIYKQNEAQTIDGWFVNTEAYTDTGSTKLVMSKTFVKDDVLYALRCTTDTANHNSFVSDFFKTFTPNKKAFKFRGVYGSKIDLFLADYNSKDSIAKGIARSALSNFSFEWKDVPTMKKLLNGLDQNDKEYYTLKNKWITAIVYTADTSAKQKLETVNFLKTQYERLRDTSIFTDKILGHLVRLRTKESYALLKKYLIQDPPLEGLNDDSEYSYGSYNNYDYNKFNFDDISDTLELAKTLFPEILQLANIDEYEDRVTTLLQLLIDSSKITAKDFETFSTKLLFDAKITLKKKLIGQEQKRKTKLEKEDEDEVSEAEAPVAAATTAGNNYSNKDQSDLFSYVTLLMPFYDINEAVPNFINKLWTLDDDQLKYKLMFKMMKHDKKYPDSLLQYFSKYEINRGDLYYRLSKINKEALFPKQYVKQELMARAFLYTYIAPLDQLDSAEVEELKKKKRARSANYDYENDDYSASGTAAVAAYDNFYSNETKGFDSIQFVKKQIVTINNKTGYVYIYKYRRLKEDNWRLAFSGLQPIDGKSISYKNFITTLSETKIVDTKSLEEQIEFELKKIRFSKNEYSEDFFEKQNGQYNNDMYDY